MEKTFLRDLWIAWRGAVNLNIVPPYFPRMQPEIACAALTEAYVYESPNQPER
jgi:hypothetical protein